MKCNQHNCREEATWRYYWPGREPLGSCDAHIIVVGIIADAMGFPLHKEPIPKPEEAAIQEQPE